MMKPFHVFAVISMKRKRCAAKGCDNLFEPRTSFQRACCGNCALSILQDNPKESREKAKKIRKQDDRKARRAFLDSDKGRAREKADKAFNKFIRLRDGPVCICCGITKGQFHAGHYRPKGHHPALRYHEDNCHASCAQCNLFKSGNLADYRINLIEKIGLERVEWLEGPHDPIRYRVEDYKQIEATYKAKVKELEAA